jgi:putative hemolysin
MKPSPTANKQPRPVEATVLGMLVVTLVCLFVLVERGAASEFAEAAVVPGAGFGTQQFISTLLAILGIISLNALFVAAETAVDLLRNHHVKRAKDERSADGTRVQTLLDGKQNFVATCSIGSQIARMALVFVGFLVAEGLARTLAASGQMNYSYGSILLCAAVIMVPIALLNLAIGELVPKSYAILHPIGVSLRLYRFIRVVSFLLAIPAALVLPLAGIIASRFGGRASFANSNQAEEEIKTIVESAQETGEIEDKESKMLDSVFEFGDTVAREVMTPRVDMDAKPVTSAPEEVMKVILESGHSRIPLYEETDDQIVGIVHAKDLLMAMVGSNKPSGLRALMRPAIFVPENKNLHELLTEMRQQRSQMAIVQDEFGGTSGIVTIEDIVEELVGDIVDEYDQEEPDVLEVEGGWNIDGKMHLDDVNREIGSDFESDEFDTVGGFVFGLFGRQPQQGEVMDTNGYRFTVAATDGRRVQRLLVVKAEETSMDEALEAEPRAI